MFDPPAPSPALSPVDARRAARNAGAIALARILSNGSLFIWQLVLIPLLGPAQYGLYGTVGAFFLIATTVAALGMGNIIIREAARHPARAGSYLSAQLVLQTLLTLIAYVGVNGAAHALGYPEAVRVFVAIAGLSLFVDQLGTIAYEHLLARERMVINAAVDIGAVLARIALAWVLLALGYGLFGVYAAALISGLARAAFLWLALVRGGVWPRFPVDRSLARSLMIDAMPLAASALLFQAYAHADRLVTASVIGTREVAYLTAALTISYGMVEVLSVTVLVAVFPMMSRAYLPGGDNALFRVIVEKLAFFTLVIVLPLALTIAVFSDTLALIFGADFRPTANILRLTVWYAMLSMSGAVYAQALIVQNRQRTTLLIRAGGLGLNLVLLWTLLPRLGVVGAPIASIAAEALALALLARAFSAQAGIRTSQDDSRGWRRIAGPVPRVLAAAGLAGLAMIGLGSLHFVLGMAGGLIVYAAAVLGLRALRADDWAFVRRLVEAMPGGKAIARWLPSKA